MENPKPKENPVEPKKTPGIGGKIESVIERITEMTARKFEGDESPTKLNSVDRWVIKINDFKKNEYDKSIAKLTADSGSMEVSIGEKDGKIKEIDDFIEQMVAEGFPIDDMSYEKDRTQKELDKLNEEKIKIDNEIISKEGRKAKFTEGKDNIINSFVGKLEEKMKEAGGDLKALEERKEGMNNEFKEAKKKYKEDVERLDTLLSRADNILENSYPRGYISDGMRSIIERKEKLKESLNEQEWELEDLGKEMDEIKKKKEKYRKEINSLGVNNKEEEKSETGNSSDEGTESSNKTEAPNNTEKEVNDMVSFKDYVDTWNDFLKQKGFNKERIDGFKKAILIAEGMNSNKEINFDYFVKKIRAVNDSFLLIIDSKKREETIEEFETYIDSLKK